MNLKQILAFLVVGLLLGGAGVWLYPRLNSEGRRIRSLSVSPEGTDTFFDQTNTPLQNTADKSLLVVSQIDWSKIADPFFETPCYWGGQSPCLLRLRRYDAQRFAFHLMTEKNTPASKETTVFGIGRIVSKPDNLRAYFAQQNRSLEYLDFVKQLRDVSVENQLNPELVYAYLDYVLGRQQELGQGASLPPLADLITALDQNSYDQAAITQRDQALKEISKDVSSEGKTLVYVTSLFFPDVQLLEEAFGEPGAIDSYFQERMRGTFVEATFSVRVEVQKYEAQDYYSRRLQTAMAGCIQGQAHLCSSLEVDQQGNPWVISCREAVFLNDLCDGSLPDFSN